MVFNSEALKRAKAVRVKVANVEGAVDGDCEKEIRERLELSQELMAAVLHVSTKTVQSWEQHRNPVKGGDAVLLFLLKDDLNLARKLIRFEGVNCEVPKKYSQLAEYKDLNKKTITCDLRIFDSEPRADYFERIVNSHWDATSQSKGDRH